MDKIISIIEIITLQGLIAIEKMEDWKEQIHIVSYESLVLEPIAAINGIANFLNCRIGDSLEKTLSQEKCPNPVLIAKKDQKIEEIKQKASSEKFNVLMNLSKKYETFSGKK